MRTLFHCITIAAAVIAFTACGSKSQSKSATAVSLDELDDYFTVKSFKVETDAKEKGIENLGAVRGTLTLELKRNDTEMKYKPSDMDYATVGGEITSSSTYVFRADCDAVVKNMIKMAPGTTETITVNIKGCDPYNKFNSDEENQRLRQDHFDALTKDNQLGQICFDIEFKEDLKETLKDLKDILDD